jgi:hypothetical protein
VAITFFGEFQLLFLAGVLTSATNEKTPSLQFYFFYLVKDKQQQRQRPVLGLISSFQVSGVDVKITTF